LRIAPEVDQRRLVYATYRTGRSAAFLGVILPADVFQRVLLNGLAGIASLLATVVREPILTDIQVTSACAASPVVLAAFRDGVLEPVEDRVALLRHSPD